MPFRYDDDDSDLEGREEPEPDDRDSDSEELVACPACRRMMYEDAERCPHCGNYRSREEGGTRHPWWFIVGMLLCLAIALLWAVGK
jgi:hypothetical protein